MSETIQRETIQRETIQRETIQRETIQLLVNIDVPDLDAATRFYVEAFGFRVGRRLGGAGVELLGAAAPLYLLPKAPGSPAAETTRAARTYERHWTPVHLDLVVPDVETARARALAAGATAEGDISDHVWGRMARLADPFGHGVCLIEFRGRGYDALCEGAMCEGAMQGAADACSGGT